MLTNCHFLHTHTHTPQISHKIPQQGAIVARIGCSIWMPLNNDATNSTQIMPDFTIFDLNDLVHILPISEYRARGNHMNRTMGQTSTTTTTTTTAITSSRMRRNSGINKRGAQLLAIRNLPDLENGNSNSSDGS